MKMKKILFLVIAAVCMGITPAAAQKAAVSVDRVEPANWFVGMKDPSVQVMLYGKGIRDAEVTVDRAGVTLDSVVRLDSPNYLLLYLNTAGAKPGAFDIHLTVGKTMVKAPFELKAREMEGEARHGFTNADVLYMLMPDRFADGNPANNVVKGMRDQVCDRSEPGLRHGGDLEGIRRHLDYFSDLGVTALWFTPVLENDSQGGRRMSTYHGYATTDYYNVDRRFGTNADYRRLVDEAHARGLKIVMDMIFNHCGFNHPWISDLPSKDWLNHGEWLEESKGGGDPRGTSYLQTSYKLTPIKDPYASEIDVKESTEGWFVPGMPDLNQHNPHVMTYLIQNSIWWIETVGIDGIRMDTYPYAFEQPMANWMKRLLDEYPNFNVVGETWVTEPGYTAAWQKDSKVSDVNSYLPTVMDFAFYDRLGQAKSEDTDEWWKGFNKVYNGLVYDYLYPNPSGVMAFIENHDTDRFISTEQYDDNDILTLKQALALLLTMNRTPQLYYGSEVLMTGNRQHGDGNVRRDFPGGFPGDSKDAFTGAGLSQRERDMLQWTRRLLQWRKGNDVIVKGRQTQFVPYNGVYVIARRYQGKTVMTVLNGTGSDAQCAVARYAEVIGDNVAATDVLTGRRVDLTQDFAMTPRQVLVLEF